MKTKLFSQSPSPIPVTFQMDSPSFPIELEVKSKTRLIESAQNFRSALVYSMFRFDR